MVFIRARIIRDGEIMDEISKDKYNYIRAEEIKAQERGIELMEDAKLPILPEWNDELTLPPSFDEYIDKKSSNKTGEDNNG